MEKIYDNFHLLLHDLYLNGQSLKPDADMITRMARMTLEGATIVKHYERETVLRRLYDEACKGTFNNPPSQSHSIFFEIQLMINVEFFKVIVDDMLLVSAFENFAKSVLLKKGRIVHCIEAPAELKKLQREKPIHVKTARRDTYRGVIRFSQKTIGLERLLEPEYLKYYPMPELAFKGLREAIGRRNLVHFHAGTGYNVTHALLVFVKYLMDTIPLNNQKNRNKSISYAKRLHRTPKPRRAGKEAL